MKMIKSVLLGLLLVVTGTAQAEILYKAHWDDRTIWLLGTIHVASQPETQLSEHSRQALAEVDQVWLELTPDELMRGGMAMQQAGSRDGDQLEDVLSTETWTEFQALSEELGIPAMVLNDLQAWLAQLLLLGPLMESQGFSGQQGIEMQLITQAREVEQELQGLEDVQTQIEAFRRSQEHMGEEEIIQRFLSDAETLQEDLTELEQTWQRGALAELMAILEDYPGMAEMQDALLSERNHNWLEQLAELPAGDYMVAVGAGHLGGDDGLITLIREQGGEVVAYPEE